MMLCEEKGVLLNTAAHVLQPCAASTILVTTITEPQTDPTNNRTVSNESCTRFMYPVGLTPMKTNSKK